MFSIFFEKKLQLFFQKSKLCATNIAKGLLKLPEKVIEITINYFSTGCMNKSGEAPFHPKLFYLKKINFMAITYVLSEKGNPLKPEEPKKWYANAKSTGDIKLKVLGKEITQRCTVNHADTLAVLEALTQLLTDRLAEGKIVRLGDFGSFQVSIGSEGAETEEKFHASLIKTKKVTFRPGVDLKEMLNNLKFEKM